MNRKEKNNDGQEYEKLLRKYEQIAKEIVDLQ